MLLNIDEIRLLAKAGKIKWTTHIVMRMQKRGIEPSDVYNCMMTGSIIEQYPTDYPYPSCLILGSMVSGKMIHIVIGVGNGYIWLITAYTPDVLAWTADLRERPANKSQ